jgi:hypothetical protein
MLLSMAIVLGSALLAAAGGSAVSGSGDGVPSDTVITMFRDGCENRCPVFEVVIFGDGTVIVEGHYYLRRRVLATSKISVAQVKQLVGRFEEMGFYELPDDFHYKGKGCRAKEAGGQNAVITIVSGGHGNSIVHHTRCLGEIPSKLSALEDEIYATSNAAKWIRPALRR